MLQWVESWGRLFSEIEVEEPSSSRVDQLFLFLLHSVERTQGTQLVREVFVATVRPSELIARPSTVYP